MTTKVVLDPNIHATKYYMAKDEMVITTSAEMRSDQKDNLHFEIRYVTDNNGLNMSDIIQFDSGTITINDFIQVYRNHRISKIEIKQIPNLLLTLI